MIVDLETLMNIYKERLRGETKTITDTHVDEILRLIAENAALKAEVAQLREGFKLIREELREEPYSSKHLNSIDHICITALSDAEAQNE